MLGCGCESANLDHAAPGGIRPSPAPAGSAGRVHWHSIAATDSRQGQGAIRRFARRAWSISVDAAPTSLWMQPQPAVRSPIMRRWTGAVGPIAAVTGSGRTVAGWLNFVLVFRGWSPDHETIARLLRTMPDPDAALEIDQDSDWIDSSSERFLLGPESLSRTHEPDRLRVSGRNDR